MASIDTPYFGINYGWQLGENGWNVGMDENLLVIAFLLKGSVNSFEATLPPTPTAGQSVILTTDSKAYFYAGDSWVFVAPVVGWEISVLSDGTRFRWTGSAYEQIPTNEEIQAQVGSLEASFTDLVLRVSNLESAVGDISTDASNLEVTADSLTKTLSTWMTFVRDRQNHIGTQESTTISDFVEAVSGAVSTLLTSTTLSIEYDDGGDTLSLENKNSLSTILSAQSGSIDLSSTFGSVSIELSGDITGIDLPISLSTYRTMRLQFAQDVTGGHTVTGWAGGVEWLDGAEPTVDTAAEATTIIDLFNIGGAGWFGYNVSSAHALRGELGSAAFEDSSAFDPAGSASDATTAANTYTDDTVAPIATDLSNLNTEVDNLTTTVGTKVGSDGTVNQVIKLTQAAYDALTPTATTLYIIID